MVALIYVAVFYVDQCYIKSVLSGGFSFLLTPAAAFMTGSLISIDGASTV